ncbi:MAG TPA: hypothetical protein VN604_08140, partial [Nitrospirota bacterium]|nr:hypothetical protein [Nitrospirota bacterium]
KLLRAFAGSIVFGIMNYVAIMGFLLTINAVFDWGTKRTYDVKVIETSVEGKGRNTRYYITIPAAWTDTKENYKIHFSRQDYLHLGLTRNSDVAITVGNGSLGFPWIEVLKK